MTEVTDEARQVRKGEELDTQALEAYFRERVPELQGPIEVLQFPSGHSNLTYLLRIGDREVVMRRPPFGSKVKSAHDMGREHTILSALHPIYPKAPRPIHFCEDENVIGAQFYVMERLHGVILRRELPEDLTLSEQDIRRLCEVLIDHQAELHGLDYTKAGLGEMGRPQGYVERQVGGWTKRYYGSQTDDVPVVERVAKWLDAHKPDETGAALIHNDYKFDNVVLDPQDLTHIIGILDWEMSTVGDPLMDLGTTLSYWVQADDNEGMHFFAAGPTHLPGAMTRQELLRHYEQRSGRKVADPVFYYAFGLFKTAVVLQQIYYRYKQGLTQDPRFAMLGQGVQLLCEQADRAIRNDAI